MIPPFLDHGGAAGAACRAIDWSAHPLGPPQDWPRALQAAVGTLLAAAHPMMVVWGSERRIIFNDSFGSVLDPWQRDAIGEPMAEIFADIWPALRATVEGVLAGKPSWHPNWEYVTRRSGRPETAYFSISGSPLRDDDGAVGGLLAVCSEITGAYLQHQLLTTESRKLRDLFEKAPGFIAMSSGPEHRVEFTNAAFRRLNGERDLIGLTIRESVPEAEEQGFLEILDHVYATGTPFIGRSVLFRFEDRPGEVRERYMDVSYQAITDVDGRTTGLVAQGHDVTEEMLSKERAQRLQTELIHVSRLSAMGTMAATLAHELNQPLTAIGNYVRGSQRLLRAGTPEGVAPVIDALDIAADNAQRAGDVIRSLRKMTVRGEVQSVAADLAPIVEEAVSLARVGAEDHAVSCEVEIEAGLTVKIDRIQIQQVVLNLVRNASEAVAECDTRRIEILVGRDGDDALVCVHDSGPGIPPERLEMLFQPFVSTKEEGMGIGLSISRTIVESHGGRLWAANHPNGGALFCFSLPLAEDLPAAAGV